MSDFTDFLVKVDDLVWGIPLIVLILAAGIYLTFRLRLLQIVHLPKALKYMFRTKKTDMGKLVVLEHYVQHYQQQSVQVTL